MNVELEKVQVLGVEPGDHIVLSLNQRLSQEDFRHVMEIIDATWNLPDDITVVILEAGMTVKIIRTQTGEHVEAARREVVNGVEQ